jgi:WD40 repeat protein
MDVAQAIWASQDHVALGLRSGHIVPIALSALDRTRTQKIQAHESAVMALSFSNDGKFLASIGDNCRIWAVNF